MLNFGIGLFNLVPVGPIDGGRMFQLAMYKLFGKETVEGLRISNTPPETRKTITPTNPSWKNVKAAYLRDGNLDAVLAKVDIAPEHHQEQQPEH